MGNRALITWDPEDPAYAPPIDLSSYAPWGTSYDKVGGAGYSGTPPTLPYPVKYVLHSLQRA